MANLTTVLLPAGKEELLNPDIIASPKYFRVSDSNIPLDTPGGEALDAYGFWYQKNIDIYKIVDQDTVEFTCIIEAEDATNNTKSIVLYLDNPDPALPDIEFILANLSETIPAGNRCVITIQFKITKASEIINFKFIKTDKLEEGLLSLNTLITLGTQITKNTTLLNQLYIPDILDNPNITSETFSI